MAIANGTTSLALRAGEQERGMKVRSSVKKLCDVCMVSLERFYGVIWGWMVVGGMVDDCRCWQ